MPARGPLGGGPGPGVARKYSCNFLKVLQRVRASGRRRHGASPRPPAPPWTRSRHRVPGTGPRGRLGVHRPRRGAAGREPGTSTLPPARAPTGRTTRPPSRPEKQPCGAPLRLATATDADAEHREPGRLREQANIKLNSPGPHPQTIGWGADKAGRRKHLRARPAHPGQLPAADALTDGRPEGRIDRLPQPARSGRRPRPRRRRLRPAGVGRTRRRVGPRAAGGRGVVRVGLLGRPGAGRVQICCKGVPRPDRPRIKARNINDSLPALRRDRGLCNRFGQPTLR